MFYFDYYYLILVVPAMIFALIAQASVKGAYSKYSKVGNYKGITGAQAARMVLDSKGLTNVRIGAVAGTMTDHFDPRTNVIRLSEGVYNTASVAAVGIAAHEAGHAIQHAEKYLPNKIRSTLVPIANFGSNISIWLILAGILLQPNVTWLAYIGIALFATSTLFSLVTLPVEFNASSRALAILSSEGIVNDAEKKQVKKVLSAAAKTYVAALAVSVAQLLRIILIVSGNSRRR